LDRNGGNGGYPDILFINIPIRYYANFWVATGAYSNNCRIKLTASDKVGNYAEVFSPYTFALRPYPGDVTHDGVVDVNDIMFLVQYVYYGGPAPNPLCTGEVILDGVVDIGDIVYIITYVFYNGPAPIDACGFKKEIVIPKVFENKKVSYESDRE
jgi:hypothetical protein